jgi:hypothetical protein
MSELSEGSGLLVSGAGSPCLLGIGLGARFRRLYLGANVVYYYLFF